MKAICETLTLYSSTVTKAETWNLKLNDEFNFVDPEINNTFRYKQNT